MVDTDYEAVPAEPKSARPRRTYTRKKAPVALPSSSDTVSSSPRKAVEAGDNFGGAGSEKRKRARNGELDEPTVARTKVKVGVFVRLVVDQVMKPIAEADVLDCLL